MSWYLWIIIGAIGGIVLGVIAVWFLIIAALEDFFKRRR